LYLLYNPQNSQGYSTKEKHASLTFLFTLVFFLLSSCLPAFVAIAF
jgi:hypothetical protein